MDSKIRKDVAVQTNQNPFHKMDHHSFTQLAWFAAFLFMLPSVVIISIGIVWEVDHYCFIDNRRSELEFLKICDFDNFRFSAMALGIAAGVILVCGIIFGIFKYPCDKSIKRTVTVFVVAVFECAALIIAIYFYIEIRLETKITNWNKLHTEMKTSLKEHYKVDNVSSEHPKSNRWNMIFIEFECCGVDRVWGTTNDFDNTPWCTTSGSCQITASQIPRSCCKNLNEFDYDSAPSTCHASVSPDTYHEKGCFSVIKKETKKKKETLRKAMDDTLAFITTVLFIMLSYAIWHGASMLPCSVCSKIKDQEYNDQGKNLHSNDKVIPSDADKKKIGGFHDEHRNESNYEEVIEMNKKVFKTPL